MSVADLWRVDSDDLLCGNDRGQEFDHLQGVRSAAVEEIQAILDFFYGDGILLCVVLDDKLLEVQERPFVRDLLADLDQSFPGVFRG